MRHVDGIGVNIASFKAEPRAEYHNPHEKRHGKFEGGFASRLIASAVGRQFMVQLEVAPEFHLLRSEGIIIIISIGDRTRLLTYAENAQCFWIPAQRFEKRRKYSIDRFKVWQNAESAHPTQQVPLYFPRPASDGESASADWMMKDEDFTANEGCISVYVARSSLNNERGSVDGTTDPPEAWRHLNLERSTPEVIHGHWANPTEASDYIFEFRNLGTDASYAEKREADPVFGHDDEERRTRIWLDSLDNSDAHSKWGDWEYVDGKGDAAFNGSDFTPNRGYTKRRTANNNKHLERNAPPRPNHKLDHGNLRSRVAAQNPSFCGADNEDDEEELPVACNPEVKEEPAVKTGLSSPQPPKPPQDGPVDQAGVPNADIQIEPPAVDIVDLTMDDAAEPEIKAEPTGSGGAGGNNNNDFDLELRAAEIERDARFVEIEFRRQQVAIERRKRYHERKKRDGS
ncbi:hypothetical protein LTR37_014049 [Vermiconidia calcicola]|uniref:Uncharacterized protein n=1 Tax=Vermiconidia calcicola TaxID=1690605 RepID=A0ACC3MVF4_9PEZI|nr:hypothetical protein LTR37_014049 [Vermiconidia calcicola]